MKAPRVALGSGFKKHEGLKPKKKPEEKKELKAGKNLKGAGTKQDK